MKCFLQAQGLGALSLSLLLLATACDSTPRERQELAKRELTKLDTAAAQGGRTLKRVGRQTLAFDSANRARRTVPLDEARQQTMDQQLLGSTAGHIGSLTVGTIAGAYGTLLRAVRAHHAGWQLRDWDYAQNTYQRLNQQLKQIRLDLPAREELRIRAWQAEFTALRAKRTATELRAATRKPTAK